MKSRLLFFVLFFFKCLSLQIKQTKQINNKNQVLDSPSEKANEKSQKNLIGSFNSNYENRKSQETEKNINENTEKNRKVKIYFFI